MGTPNENKRQLRAIAHGGAVALVTRVQALEARQADIARQLVSVKPVPRLKSQVIEDRLTEWRRLLRQSTTQAGAVVQRVLAGRITFTPITGQHQQG